MTKVQIDGNHWLEAPAAAAYARARAAGLPAGVTSAGRTREQQTALYTAWKAGRMPGTPSVALPGTSRHESGRALDLPEPARAWMRKNGEFYGWIWPAWARRAGTYEPWHFEYQQSLDLASLPSAGIGTKPEIAEDTKPEITKEQIEMETFLLWSGPVNTRRWALIQAGRALEISAAVAANFKVAGITAVATDAKTFTDFLTRWGA